MGKNGTLHTKVREMLQADAVLCAFQEEYTPFVKDTSGKVRKWRLDFAWPQWRIALEVQGGTGGGAGHTMHATGEEYERYNTLIANGWRVLQVGNRSLRGEGADRLLALLRGLLIGDSERVPDDNMLGSIRVHRLGDTWQARCSWKGIGSGSVTGPLDEVVPWAIAWLAKQAADEGTTP